MSALHEAVARAIAEALDELPGPAVDEAATEAIGVVLAEAKRSIEALDWHIAGEGPPEDEPLLIDRSEALAVLAALGEQA